MENQFSRTELIIGKEKQEILKNAKVAVFGIGGVGSYVVEGLVRTGIKNFVLIDNVIVNTENVSDIYVKYFQYAGISIFQCNKENAEMYMLVMTCKNGKAETISFSSIEELEKYRKTIENSITNLKSSQMNIG